MYIFQKTPERDRELKFRGWEIWFFHTFRASTIRRVIHEWRRTIGPLQPNYPTELFSNGNFNVFLTPARCSFVIHGANKSQISRKNSAGLFSTWTSLPRHRAKGPLPWLRVKCWLRSNHPDPGRGGGDPYHKQIITALVRGQKVLCELVLYLLRFSSRAVASSAEKSDFRLWLRLGFMSTPEMTIMSWFKSKTKPYVNT